MSEDEPLIPPSYGPAIKCFAGALLLVILSAVLIWGLGAAQQLVNEGRAKLPGTVEFEGEEGGYDVFVSRRVGQGTDTQELVSSRVDCEVTRNGEPLATIDGARQAARTVTSFGASVGSFQGGTGRIAVTCGFTRSTDARGVSNRFVVAKQRGGIRYAAYGGFALAAVLALVGFVLVRRVR